MSSISSRPKVQSVSSTVLADAAGVGAVLTVAVAAALLHSVSFAAREIYRVYSRKGPSLHPELKPVPELRRETKLSEPRLIEALRGLDAVEALKVKTLLTLEHVPFCVESSRTLQESFAALGNASSSREAQECQRRLYRTIETGHHKIFTRALTLACATASRKTSFNSVETASGEDFTRVIATNPAGRTLVTEIRISAAGDPSIETEVVGVTDGSCNGILDAFDKALTEEGVRSAPPSRKFTGGVCELAAARDFVRKKITRNPAAKEIVAKASQGDGRHRHRLNAPRTTKNQNE